MFSPSVKAKIAGKEVPFHQSSKKLIYGWLQEGKTLHEWRRDEVRGNLKKCISIRLQDELKNKTKQKSQYKSKMSLAHGKTLIVY
jgi:hypothetical protein